MTTATPGTRERDPLVAFLRAVGAAVGTARLYPGELSRPELGEAVARACAAGGRVAAGGPAAIEIVGGRLHAGGHELPSDPHLDRVADACYARRIEHFAVRDPPTDDDLRVLVEVLTTPAERLAATGARTDYLADRGVRSMELATAVPQPTTGRHSAESDVAEHEPSTWTDAPDDSGLEVVVEAVPGEDAASLFERLRGVHDALSDDVAGRSTFFERATDAVTGLPPTERAAFGRLAIDLATEEPFAARYLSHLTDLGLAGLALDVASIEDRNAVSLARELVGRVGRHDEVVRVVQAAVAGREPTAGARGAMAVRTDDLTARALRDDFPSRPEDVRDVTLRSLRDYATLEDDEGRLTRVVASVARSVREACLRFDVDEVERLTGLLAEVEGRGGPVVAQAVRHHRREAVDAALVAELATAAAARSDAAAGVSVLAPFGAAAVEALVDALAGAEEASVRGAVVALLAALTAQDLSMLTRHLDHPQWFVVRNLATVLGRVGSAEAVAALGRVARHDHASVRREALRGLGATSSEGAARTLAGLVRSAPKRRDAADYLEALAEHPSRAAAGLLAELGTTGPGALPWSTRRLARRLARRRGSA